LVGCDSLGGSVINISYKGLVVNSQSRRELEKKGVKKDEKRTKSSLGGSAKFLVAAFHSLENWVLARRGENTQKRRIGRYDAQTVRQPSSGHDLEVAKRKGGSNGGPLLLVPHTSTPPFTKRGVQQRRRMLQKGESGEEERPSSLMKARLEARGRAKGCPSQENCSKREHRAKPVKRRGVNPEELVMHGACRCKGLTSRWRATQELKGENSTGLNRGESLARKRHRVASRTKKV